MLDTKRFHFAVSQTYWLNWEKKIIISYSLYSNNYYAIKSQFVTINVKKSAALVD